MGRIDRTHQVSRAREAKALGVSRDRIGSDARGAGDAGRSNGREIRSRAGDHVLVSIRTGRADRSVADLTAGNGTLKPIAPQA